MRPRRASSSSSSTSESKRHFSPPFPPLASPLLANLLRIRRVAPPPPLRAPRSRADASSAAAPGLRSAASFFSLGRHRENSTQVAARLLTLRPVVCLFILFVSGRKCLAHAETDSPRAAAAGSSLRPAAGRSRNPGGSLWGFHRCHAHTRSDQDQNSLVLVVDELEAVCRSGAEAAAGRFTPNFPPVNS